MNFSFNIQDLLKAASESSAFQIEVLTTEELPRLKTVLGTPIVGHIQVPQFSYQVFANLEQRTIVQERFDFPPVSIVTVRQQKNIVKTAVQGRAGTVKEYISDGDFDVEIQGVISNFQNNAYPERKINELVNLCKIPTALPVVGELFELLGIYQIVIEDYEISELQGVQNAVSFSLKCVSDMPIELSKIPKKIQ